jgi:Tol biopolymer transport system component
MTRSAQRSGAFATLALALAATVFPAPALGARKAHKVSGPAVAGSDVDWPDTRPPRISPDGEWIVWIQDAETNNSLALWAARRSGGAAKRLSGTLAPGGTFIFVRISPDSRYLLYTADQEVAGRHELYTVPLLGTAANGIKLNPPLLGTDNANNPTFSPDGTRVVFTTSTIATTGHSLFSSPIDGSAPAVGLDGPFSAAGGTDEFVVTNARVIFQRLPDTSTHSEIWSVPIAGPAVAGIRLCPNASGSVDKLVLSPDRSRVLFRGRDFVDHPGLELWIANVAGPADSALLLAPVPAAGGNVGQGIFTPDGTRVVFDGDLDVDEQLELYSVPANGSAPPIKLNTGFVAAGDLQQFMLSPDGTRVVYTADWAAASRRELFSVPVAGPSAANIKLNRALTAGESVAGIVPVEDLVVFGVANTAQTVVLEVRGASYEGPSAADWPIVVPETSVGTTGAIVENWAVLNADFGTPGDFALWTARNNGSGVPNNLYNNLWTSVVLGSSVAISPDQDELFFVAEVNDQPMELWQTRVDGSQTNPRLLSLDPVASGGVIDATPGLEVSPDGHGILYEADADVSGREELYISDSLVFAADFDEEGDLSEWAP